MRTLSDCKRWQGLNLGFSEVRVEVGIVKVLVTSASLVLSDYLLSSEGTHCYNLFKHLSKYGYEFEALSPYIRIRNKLSNVSPHQVGSLRVSPTSAGFYKFASHSEFQARCLIAARKLLKKERFDIIHHMLPAVFNYTFSSLALSAKGFKQPLVFGPLSVHYFGRPLNERILVPLTSRLHRKTIEKCDRIIAISNHVRSLYARFIDEEKISVIPFAVDTDMFKPVKRLKQEDECSLLYAGSLYPLKGVRFLIMALAEVRKLGLKANLKIVGEGRQRPELTRLAEKLGIDNSVVFEGFVPHTHMAECYRQCDIFCFPSLGEPFGKAIIEAMACGKPVVATKTGGATDIIQDDVDGVLVPPANPAALASEIARLVNDGKMRQRLGARARDAVVERFSWNAISEEYHKLYSELL
jgi:glycosyltransferase involved in cell wall biosynthesis